MANNHESAGTVVLEAAGRRFTESRTVLATCSDFFAAMFATPMADQNAATIPIGEIDSATVFGDFLDVLGGRAVPNRVFYIPKNKLKFMKSQKNV
jgi:hypothetical protein